MTNTELPAIRVKSNVGSGCHQLGSMPQFYNRHRVVFASRLAPRHRTWYTSSVVTPSRVKQTMLLLMCLEMTCDQGPRQTMYPDWCLVRPPSPASRTDIWTISSHTRHTCCGSDYFHHPTRSSTTFRIRQGTKIQSDYIKFLTVRPSRTGGNKPMDR